MLGAEAVRADAVVPPEPRLRLAWQCRRDAAGDVDAVGQWRCWKRCRGGAALPLAPPLEGVVAAGRSRRPPQPRHAAMAMDVAVDGRHRRQWPWYMWPVDASHSSRLTPMRDQQAPLRMTCRGWGHRPFLSGRVCPSYGSGSVSAATGWEEEGGSAVGAAKPPSRPGPRATLGRARAAARGSASGEAGRHRERPAGAAGPLPPPWRGTLPRWRRGPGGSGARVAQAGRKDGGGVRRDEENEQSESAARSSAGGSSAAVMRSSGRMASIAESARAAARHPGREQGPRQPQRVQVPGALRILPRSPMSGYLPVASTQAVTPRANTSSAGPGR